MSRRVSIALLWFSLFGWALLLAGMVGAFR
jgi:hypothetical protein